MEKHTQGALRAAAVIMNGRAKIKTDYGEKTAEGIADLIDRETGAGELLEALEVCLKRLESIREIIAKAEGRP